MITSSMKTSELEKSAVVGIPIDASLSIDTSLISEEEKAAKEEKKNFRISAKNVCLHYPKGHGLTRQSILEQLTAIFKDQINNYLIAMESSTKPRSRELDKSSFHVIDKELHHFHVFLEFFSKVNITSPFGFDLLGSNGEQVHGHYHTMKKREAVMRYFAKEDKELLTSFDLTVDGKEKTADDFFMESLSKIARERGVNAAMKEFCDKKPEMIATRYNAVKTNLTQYVKSFPLPAKSRFPADSFKKLPELDYWYKNLRHEHSVILVGKGGKGKTELILAYFEALKLRVFLCRDINDLNDLTDDYDVILFDDINTAKMTPQQRIQLFEVAHSSSIRILYTSKKIDAHMLKAFTVNRIEALIPKSQQNNEALMRRVTIIPVTTQLFNDREVHITNTTITNNNYFAVSELDKINKKNKKGAKSIGQIPPAKKSKALLEKNVVEATIIPDVEAKKVKTKYKSMSKVKKKTI